MAGKTYVNSVLSGNALTAVLAGSDGVGIAIGHTLFDANGVPIGTMANPLITATDAAADTALETIATQTAGLATAAGQVNALAEQTASAMALGTPADAAWASGAGSVVALLKAAIAAIKGTLTATVSGSVSVSNFPATQPVSGTVALSGTSAVADAATEAALGSPADAAYSGSGNAGAIALLKGLYAKLAGTLTATISGSVAVTGTFWQTTQPVSLAALPALAAGSNAIGSVSVSNAALTYAAPAVGTVTTSSSLLVAAGTYSNLLILGDDPAQASDVFIAIGPVGSTTAVVGSGLCMATGGGAITFGKGGVLPMPASNQAIYAIARTGTVTIPIQGA